MQKPVTGLLGRRRYDKHVCGGGMGEKEKRSGLCIAERKGAEEVMAMRNGLI